MNRICTLLFVLLGLTGAAFSQKNSPAKQNPYAAVDQLMDKKNTELSSMNDIAAFINATFIKEEDKARAVFYWITKNISYSADLMFTYSNDNNRCRMTKDAFENKTAVCIGYSALFDTLCKLSHLTSYVVEGSTRQSFLPTVIGHAWNAVKINNTWRLIDATWGSGYLQGKKFVRSRNDFYYLTPPEKLITSHLPIDPIWQLLSRPLSLYQFHGQLKSTVKTDWNYTDSIAVFLASTEIEKTQSTMRRLAEFGTESEITANYYNYLKSKELVYYNERLTLAVQYDNEAVNLYNDYINFKNKQFTPTRPDNEIAAIMPAISEKMDLSKALYGEVMNKVTDAGFNSVIENNYKQQINLRENVKSETAFVNKYLATKKNKRRDLFYTKTYTLWGIPVK